MKNNRFEIDMTSGSIMPKLISFSLPLMLSGILQLLFNAVDLVVVGRFAGKDSLAAVGATSALLNIFITLFIGISLGANVCAARAYAAEDYKRTNAVVHTATLTALVSGVGVLCLGQLLSRPALALMDTPAGIIDKSVLYMQIYFAGTPFVMLYNFGAAILRAVGDTKRPMIYLVVSGVVNAGLNILLVTVFSLDVAGVAIATVFSQALSCIMVVITLTKSPEAYRLHLSQLRIDKRELRDIVRIGLPAGLQGTVITASNVLLQSSVNSFGESAMAGYTAANNVFGFLFTSVNSITQGCLSFTSQNYGAGKYSRMKRVLADCLVLETVVCFALGSVAYFFGAKIIGIYSSAPEVIEYGVEILSITTLTYFLCGYMDCIPGALRGMGHSGVPMILSIIGTVGMRLVWIYGFFPHNRDMKFLFYSYPLSWTFTLVMQLACYMFIWHGFSKKHNTERVDNG